MDLNVKIPYISLRDNLAVFGSCYQKGDLVWLNPNFDPHRVIIRNGFLVKKCDYDEFDKISEENGLIINDKTYCRGQLIKQKSEDIKNINNLLQYGQISLHKQETVSKTEIVKPIIENIKYHELAKKYNLKPKELFEKLKTDSEINNILGEKPHHMSIVDNKVLEKAPKILGDK